MTVRKIAFGIFTAGLLLAGSHQWQSADAQTTRARLEADAQLTAGGADDCLRCHAGETMVLMADTPHGNLGDPHTPYSQQGCESCHGPGSLHVSRAAGGAGKPPLLQFGADGVVAEQTAACTSCHAEDMGELEGLAWADSLHDTEEITCVSCHTLHTLEKPLADISSQRESCAECHKQEIRDHSKFEGKGIIFDQLACYDCHDVHQLIAQD